jgi:hypothetical protein
VLSGRRVCKGWPRMSEFLLGFGLLIAAFLGVNEWGRRKFWQTKYNDLHKRYLEQGDQHHRFLMAVFADAQEDNNER